MYLPAKGFFFHCLICFLISLPVKATYFFFSFHEDKFGCCKATLASRCVRSKSRSLISYCPKLFPVLTISILFAANSGCSKATHLPFYFLTRSFLFSIFATPPCLGIAKWITQLKWVIQWNGCITWPSVSKQPSFTLFNSRWKGSLLNLHLSCSSQWWDTQELKWIPEDDKIVHANDTPLTTNFC